MKLCERRRQDFIDCMFSYSKCVQAGHPFDECLKSEAKQDSVDEKCKQKWRDWIRCRQQMYDPRTRFRGYRDS